MQRMEGEEIGNQRAPPKRARGTAKREEHQTRENMYESRLTTWSGPAWGPYS